MLTHRYLNTLIRAMFNTSNQIDLGTSASAKMSGSGYMGPKTVQAFHVAFGGDASAGPHTASNSSTLTTTVYFGEATAAWPEISHFLLTVPNFATAPIFAGELNGGTPISIQSGEEIKVSKYAAATQRGFIVTVSAV